MSLPGTPPPMTHPSRHAALAVLLLGVAGQVAALPARQGEAGTQPKRPVTDLPRLVVHAGRLRLPPFDLPAAVTEVDVAPARAGRPGVDLSEALVGVPGILARDRQDRAQDEQISIRGFGARASFGVRGVRIYVDGIPATMPDGQGQVSHINLDAAARIEVMRGPFSALYGNASGGVVQVWSADGTPRPVTVLGVDAGSRDLFRYSADTRGSAGPVGYNVAASQLVDGGYRRHGRARRASGNAKFGIDMGGGRHLTLVLNTFDQPVAQDPQGLTRAGLHADPRAASPSSLAYDTRKSTRQNQLGLVYEQTLGERDRLRAMAYGGQRGVLQFLSIPVATQRDPLQPGGVVGLDANYAGADLRWTHDGALAGGDYRFALGASLDDEGQLRRGYENFVGDRLGVRGALRRDERDDVRNTAAYAQWYWRFARRWALLLGLRHDEVRFRARDFYVTPANPDDSGGVRYRATTPVAGLQFRAGARLRLYASYGKGFETPSWNELGYRADGRPGLAFDLRPAVSRNVELGAKWRSRSGLALEAAVFRADTRDELAVGSSANGRSTYRNLGDTRRQGMELSLDGELAPGWRLRASYTRLQARFESAFAACADRTCAPPGVRVPAGTRIPGVPASYGSLQLGHGGDTGWREGLTLAGFGAVTVDDTGSARAPGGLRIDLDAGYAFRLGADARLLLTARLDNVADRRLVDAVVVNDANGRYYEPAPGRSLMLGARLTF
ncbi:TonB-dependent receptor [Fulvimonas sp. R45]|uniref:TonB-dependent receptor family protein n=1 Tax=Fulvimonas sp. R45 TaxID=3045937 RepID=UPI00265F606C|nr:TonB-dependent receptor [Fulvimonas sp. R45]